MNIDLERTKSRAEAATPIVLIGAMVSKNNAEFLKSAKGDVLALIAEVAQLQSKLDRVTAERDAAVEDLTKLATKPITPCHSCSETCLFPASLAPELQLATWCRYWQWRGTERSE